LELIPGADFLDFVGEPLLPHVKRLWIRRSIPLYLPKCPCKLIPHGQTDSTPRTLPFFTFASSCRLIITKEVGPPQSLDYMKLTHTDGRIRVLCAPPVRFPVMVVRRSPSPACIACNSELDLSIIQKFGLHLSFCTTSRACSNSF
jgi:hypothetical protein